jgi:hypothetical protein
VYKNAERQGFDGFGLGYDDIDPSMPMYAEAAERWAAGWIQDSGFRSFLKGEDAFRQWYMSADGLVARRAQALSGNGISVAVDWKDLYAGWKTLYEKVILRNAVKEGKLSLVDDAFRKAAESVDATGRTIPLSQDAIRYLGPVRGIKKNPPNRIGATRMADSFFDHFFMDPVNYRRGLLNDLVVKQERARLMRLYASQGKRVVPDAELDEILELQGLAGASRTGTRAYVQDVALRNGIIPESLIDDLADARAIEEIDNVLFTWDQGSRAGQQGKAIFPFGRPWADMAGFWGREVLTRPALRGVMNNRAMNMSWTWLSSTRSPWRWPPALRIWT